METAGNHEDSPFRSWTRATSTTDPDADLWQQVNRHYNAPPPVQEFRLGSQQPMQMNNVNSTYDSASETQVRNALKILVDFLPNAFYSSVTPQIDINSLLLPLHQEIADLRNQLADTNLKYEEVLYRLETAQLAAQEMTV